MGNIVKCYLLKVKMRLGTLEGDCERAILSLREREREREREEEEEGEGQIKAREESR